MTTVTTSHGPLAEYHRRLGEGRFCLQHCEACGHAVFYPRFVCPYCHGSRLEWRDAAGTGTIYACTVINRSEKSGGPYNVVLVDLDEGVRMMSTVEAEPETVTIGQRVRLEIVDRDGEPLPVCRPILDAAAAEGGR